MAMTIGCGAASSSMRWRSVSPDRHSFFSDRVSRTPSPENTYLARTSLPPPPPMVLLAPCVVACPAVAAIVAPPPQPFGMAPPETRPSQAESDAEGDFIELLSEEEGFWTAAPKSAVDTDALIGFAKFGPGSLLGTEVSTDACSEASSLGSDHSSLPDLELPEDVPSIGSLNHPHSCGRPCKYIKKAQGCKDGLTCTHCHLCVWHSRRDGKSKRNKQVKRFCA